MSKLSVMLVHSLIFILALILSTGLLNTTLPYSDIHPSLGEVEVKLQYFTEHKDDYDIIFMGPSTTYFGVIPKLFDEFMAEQGKKIKSFNFGISGANGPEVDFYLQKILALKPANLKWIFIDCGLDLFFTDSPTSAIDIYWHTPRKTMENIQLILESPNHQWNVKVKHIYANFKSFIYRWLEIGQLSTVWKERILKSSSLKVSEDRLIQESGYYAIEWRKSENLLKNFSSEQWKRYKKNLKNEEANLETLKQYTTIINSFTSGKKLLKNIMTRIDKQPQNSKNKIEAIFFIPPTLEADMNRYAIMQAYNLGYIPTLFAFNNPKEFASLYEINRRIDSVHLNQVGAREFTLALTAKFAQYLKSHEDKAYT
jgi:hypothetical protein